MLIKNALIATASELYKGDIHIKDGIIKEIGENLDIKDEEIIDAKGNYVIPGGIDVHTHFSLDVGIAVANDDFRTGTIARRCENNFPAFLAMGYALLLATQAVFNMCVAVGLAPVTGQPLPLVSKGGTSTIINCVFLGVILSVSRSAKVRDESATAPTPATENDTESN